MCGMRYFVRRRRPGGCPRRASWASCILLLVAATGCTASSSSSPPSSSSPAPTQGSAAASVPALTSVDWPSVSFPVAAHCRHFQPPVIVSQVAYAAPAPGVDVAILLVRCNAGAGAPPVVLYVYDRALPGDRAHLAATLVDDRDNWQAGAFNAQGATVSIPVAGFSSNSVPNCCPDVQTTLSWTWDGAGYRLTSDVPRHVTGVPGGYY